MTTRLSFQVDLYDYIESAMKIYENIPPRMAGARDVQAGIALGVFNVIINEGYTAIAAEALGIEESALMDSDIETIVRKCPKRVLTRMYVACSLD